MARSFIDRLALSPNFRPISSRLLVSGKVNEGPSRGSSPPSRARGVARSVPQVSKDGKSAGEGDASVGTSEYLPTLGPSSPPGRSKDQPCRRDASLGLTRSTSNSRIHEAPRRAGPSFTRTRFAPNDLFLLGQSRRSVIDRLWPATSRLRHRSPTWRRVRLCIRIRRKHEIVHGLSLASPGCLSSPCRAIDPHRFRRAKSPPSLLHP